SVLPGGRMLVLVKRPSPPEAMTALPLVAQGAEVYRRPRGLPLLRAEDHRMDVAAWLQSLGLERYEPDGQPGDLAKLEEKSPMHLFRFFALLFTFSLMASETSMAQIAPATPSTDCLMGCGHCR